MKRSYNVSSIHTICRRKLDTQSCLYHSPERGLNYRQHESRQWKTGDWVKGVKKCPQ